ncbi:hypothetical protein [Virgisporangium ochraceum]|uniref:Uncharacterized protein n=1 Tax=Virgisporangium ochraceum TaxID=65505 RepID=A0A8J4EC77_9ACTN|nr:hypothetical protein [Virgisporangium ochraceum]GIJ69238.1 hypothetical protein Voc01_041550 [Virgisporangium ochraceum]
MHPTDDDTVVALLRPLDTDPATPSTVDIDRAMRDGRRHRRRRMATRSVAVIAAAGLAVAGSAVAVTALSGPTAAPAPPAGSASATTGPEPSTDPTRPSPITGPEPTPPTRCDRTQLPVPSGHYQTIVGGVDPTGRYVVGRSYASGGIRQLVMWDNGTLRRLPVSGRDPVLADVNSAGTAVGFRVDESEPTPFAYLNGRVEQLAPLGKATAINEAGTIVGSTGNEASKPVRWANADSEPEPLPLPAGYFNGQAIDIDEDGTVIGLLSRDSDFVPYVWFPDGTHRELMRPGNGERARFGMVRGIRNGWVVGSLRSGPKTDREAMRWNVNTNESVALPTFANDGAHAVNAHGWVAGQHSSGKAVLVTPAGIVDLPGFPGVTGFVSAAWVSDDGRTVVGNAMTAPGNYQRPVVWHCT